MILQIGRMKASLLTLSLLITVSLIMSCKKDDDSSSNGSSALNNVSEATKTAALETYADIVLNSYSDALKEAEQLQIAINTFVSSTTQENFEAVKNAWLDAREPYGQTEAYRFSNGPIDNDVSFEAPEGQLNAWPLDESYIDAIIASALVINTDLIVGGNEGSIDGITSSEGDEGKNISTGYHAIEYLLWSADDQNTSLNTVGDRDVSYFQGSGDEATRARTYLTTLADLLVADLEYLVDQWDEDGDNYRETFLDADTDENLETIFAALSEMAKGELAIERVQVAVEEKDQEEEHSCFSDNTHRDLYLNALGVANVLKGEYDAENSEYDVTGGTSL